MLANKIIKFENENTIIFNHIENYFNELGRSGRDYKEKRTDKTREAYESDIRQFFRVMRNKELKKEFEYLTYRDVEINQETYESYIDYLCNEKKPNGENKYVNKTINRKCVAVSGFIKYLKRKKVIDIDVSYLDLIKGQKERKNHYGALTSEEVLELSKFALNEKQEPKEKYLLVMLSFKTGLRNEELLNLKWNDFIEKNDCVIIKGVGKGNKEFEIKISKDFYDELKEIKRESNSVFSITKRQIGGLMNRYKEAYNIHPKRNIVFHSIRKAFGTVIYNINKDINEARIALRHENINTTQIYLGITNNDYHNVLMEIDKLDSDLFKKVNLEQLIEAISECHSSVKMNINLKLNEILKNK